MCDSNKDDAGSGKKKKTQQPRRGFTTLCKVEHDTLSVLYEMLPLKEMTPIVGFIDFFLAEILLLKFWRG